MSFEQTFDEYFNGEGTSVSFSFHEKGRKLEFIRNDIRHDEYPAVPERKGFVDFDRAIARYCRWGDVSAEFVLQIDDDPVVIYRADKYSIFLNTMMKHLDEEDYIVTDSAVYFRKKPVRKMIERTEDQVISMVRDAYKVAIDKYTNGVKKNAII